MAIPSLIAWRAKTIHVIGDRSPAMGIIDDKIREYWRASRADDREGKNKAAYAIRKACRHWADTPDNRFAAAVTNLEQEAERELSQYQPGWNEFKAAKNAGPSGNLKSLAPGYHHERRMYEAGGKQQNPVSASVLRDAALADALPGANAHHLITAMDDQTWDGYANGPVGAGGPQNRVLFFDKQERLEHMLLVLGGRLIWAKNNKLFTTGNDPFMYAMDSYGNLFARADNLGAEQFNHSSFNAGREVICAGMICATDGQLDFISNASGHYQPTRSDLFSCVKKLRDARVKMVFPMNNTRTRVRVLGVGDWPAIAVGATPGFDHVADAIGGDPPAAIPVPETFTRW
jgi:hypothetical protein